MQESALTLDAERTEELPACVRTQDPRMLGVVDGRKLTIAPSLQGGKHPNRGQGAHRWPLRDFPPRENWLTIPVRAGERFRG